MHVQTLASRLRHVFVAAAFVLVGVSSSGFAKADGGLLPQAQGEQLRRFVDEVQSWHGVATIGVLPLVMQEQSLQNRVSELGVALSEEVALGFGKSGVGPSGLKVALAEVGLQQATFEGTKAALSIGPGLGVDVVVVGRIKCVSEPHGVMARVIKCELDAINLLAGRAGMPGGQCMSVQFQLTSRDSAASAAFALKDAQSSWTVGDPAWVQRAASLDEQLVWTARTVARRLIRSEGGPLNDGKPGRLHIEPARFTQLVVEQRDLLARTQSLVNDAMEWSKQGIPGSPRGSFQSGGKSHESPEQAFRENTKAWNDLETSEAGRMGRTMVVLLESALRELRPELEFTAHLGISDSVRARLVTETLLGARECASVQSLASEGVSAVLIPRIDRVGDQCAMRVELRSVCSGRVTCTAIAALPSGGSAEFAEKIGARTRGGVAISITEPALTTR